MECSCRPFQNAALLHLDAAEHSHYINCDVSDWMDSALPNFIAHFGDNNCSSDHEWPCFLDAGQLSQKERGFETSQPVQNNLKSRD